MKRTLVLLTGVIFLAGTVLRGNADSEAGNEIRYTFLILGNKAGFENSSRNPDGSLRLYYEFNDRGRGPKITEQVSLGSKGIPTQIQNTGNDYEKAPVDERFLWKAGGARWKNRAEEGSKQVSGEAFYVSLSGVPEETALLARALLAAGRSLPLLPAGEASIEEWGTLKVEAEGRSRTVVQYAINGLDFTPTPIWLDEDGTFFASVSSWFSVVREGWEPAVDALNKAQEEKANKRSAELAKKLGHKPSSSLALVHANLFDSESAKVRPDMTVLVTGDRISSNARAR